MSWNDDVIKAFRESKGETNHWGPKLVIMHTIGAKSGEERLAPVVGFHRDGGWQVVASKGGSPENPAWYHNLLANPRFELEAIEDGEIVTVPVVASEVPADEWKGVYDSIVDEAPQFGEYLTKTDRQIPVFRLARA